jgi:nucleoid DNA-binding protein
MAGKNKSDTSKPAERVAKATSAGRKSRVSSGQKTAPAKSDEAMPLVAATPSTPSSKAEGRPHLRAVDPGSPLPPLQEVAPSVTPGKKAAGKANKDGAYKRQDLLEAICARKPGKRADAKALLEVMLSELGRALDGNAELVLPPLGKLAVKRRKPDESGPDILTVKLRRMRDGQGEAGETPLAAAREDG